MMDGLSRTPGPAGNRLLVLNGFVGQPGGRGVTKRGRIFLFGLDRRIQVGLFTVVMPSMGYGIAIS